MIDSITTIHGSCRVQYQYYLALTLLRHYWYHNEYIDVAVATQKGTLQFNSIFATFKSRAHATLPFFDYPINMVLLHAYHAWRLYVKPYVETYAG
jgi:hypothetical protein